MAPFAQERKVAIHAVLKASALCQATFKMLVNQTLVKPDLSPVTVADFGVQAIVNDILHKAFPDDPIVGEEDSSDLLENDMLDRKVVELVQSSYDSQMAMTQVHKAIDRGQYKGGPKGRFWTIDPIDGTKGFLRGEQYAVCLALVEDGRVQLGVLGCPNLLQDIHQAESQRGSLFIAVRGQGSFERTLLVPIERQISMKLGVKLQDHEFCESVEAAHSKQDTAAKIAAHLNITKPSIRMDSQCKYGVLARGDAGIYLRLPTNANYEEKIWDHAGGSLLVEEAGGKVSDMHGKPLDFSIGRTLSSNQGVIASSADIHEQVLKAVNSVL